MPNPPITTGLHAVSAACPRCGRTELIHVSLTVTLTTPQHDVPTLKVKAKSKPLAHDCRQTRVTDPASPVVDVATGEILGGGDSRA